MEMELNDNESCKTKKTDAPCCEKCAYVLVKDGQIYCNDRGFIMRMLFGLTKMRPGAHCNAFVPQKTR